MLWCKRHRAARLHFGFVAAIHAKQKYGVGRMRFGVRCRPKPVRLHGAPECGVCIVHPAETDIRVCEGGERWHVGRVESYRTRQRLRRWAEALRILMQSPEQRPGFSIRRVGSDCALEVCCRFAYRLSGNQDPREQFPRLEIVGAFRQQALEIRTSLYIIACLSERKRATSDGIRI